MRIIVGHFICILNDSYQAFSFQSENGHTDCHDKNLFYIYKLVKQSQPITLMELFYYNIRC